MGRIFEKRKHKMFARFDKMSKAFTRLGKEIAIAVKQGGPEPDNNPRLRAAIQTGKGLNMPKDRIEAAIKRASSKDEKELEEVSYEGYGPHGIAIYCECATDNTNRTVANLRSHFSKGGGALGTKGSLDFIFERKGIFKIPKGTLDVAELEFELIDFGAEQVEEHEGEIYISTSFHDYGAMQKALEEKGMTILSSELKRIPNSTTALSEAQQEEVYNLILKLEEDDDVQAVFHNMEE